MPTSMHHFSEIEGKTHIYHFFRHFEQNFFLGSREPIPLKMGENRDNYTLVST